MAGRTCWAREVGGERCGSPVGGHGGSYHSRDILLHERLEQFDRFRQRLCGVAKPVHHVLHWSQGRMRWWRRWAAGGRAAVLYVVLCGGGGTGQVKKGLGQGGRFHERTKRTNRTRESSSTRGAPRWRADTTEKDGVRLPRHARASRSSHFSRHNRGERDLIKQISTTRVAYRVTGEHGARCLALQHTHTLS